MKGTAVAAGSIPASTGMIAVVNDMSIITIMIIAATGNVIIMRAIAGNTDFIGASPHEMSALQSWRPIFGSCRLKSRQSKSTSRI